jgi:glycosyltransferase involved in cell wall biosynthesis
MKSSIHAPPLPSRSTELVPTHAPRVGIVADLLEERWYSMDLVAEMLVTELAAIGGVQPAMLRPSLRRRMTRLPFTRGRSSPDMIDRVINRFVDYPAWLERRASQFELFHIVDHSYAHLAERLPRGRTVVTCHDVDALRPLLRTSRSPRGRLLASIARRVGDGLAAATRVICDSAATRDALLEFGIVAPARIDVIWLGAHPVFSPAPDDAADADLDRHLPAVGHGTNPLDLLHVGSTIDRKRIDTLIEILAGVRRTHPGARLIRAGGALTHAQSAHATKLGVRGAIVDVPELSRRTLAALYRRCAMVLLPSSAEGFGVPIVEAMASATPVIASDLAVLREIGGDAARYEPVGDVARWTSAILQLADERQAHPERWTARRTACIAHAAQFSWTEYARRTAAVYEKILNP